MGKGEGLGKLKGSIGKGSENWEGNGVKIRVYGRRKKRNKGKGVTLLSSESAKKNLSGERGEISICKKYRGGEEVGWKNIQPLSERCVTSFTLSRHFPRYHFLSSSLIC